MEQTIPKFIKDNPWYKNGQEELKKDHSATASTGYREGYDSKRDQYDNFTVVYNDDESQPTNYDAKHHDATKTADDNEDDDDANTTDYELERKELQLDKTDLKKMKLIK